MRPKGTNRMVTCAAALAAAMTVASATSASAQAPSEARIQELMRQAAAQLATGQTPSTPGQTPPATGSQTTVPAAPVDTRPAVRLGLEDAVKLALDQNLDIAVQRLNPQINDIAIASVKAVYHPALTSNVSDASLSQLPTSQLIGGTNVLQKTLTYNGGVAQNTPWGGGSLSVTLNNFRQESTSNNVLFNPAFNSNWAAAYTQPLVRGFRIDSTRQQLQVTKINRDMSDVQLRATITNTLSNVRNAYWDYVFAVQSVDVARQSVSLAEQLVKDNQTRVEVGTMAPIDVVQAQSQAATQRQNLVAAQATMRTAELALKRLIVGGTQDPMWRSAIDPIDRPDFRPETIDVEAAVRRALSERTDLALVKQNVAINDITLKFLRDQTLPAADLQATYGFQGIGGTQYVRATSGSLGAAPTTIVPGGFGDALSALLNNRYPRWTFALNVTYPIGTSTADAAVAKARVQLNQVQAQIKQIELQVATDVTNAAVTVQSNSERVQAAQVARQLAQQQLDAENSKFEVGMSTNYLVVQSQRDLATAQNNELQAILAYRKSLVELERLQQTTLTNLGITVLSTGGLNNTAVGSGRPTVVAGGGGQ